MKPWKQLSKKTVYANRYRKMYRLRYRLPNRRQGNFYLTERGRVVCVLVITRDRQVVLAKQFRPGPNRILWELVGGAIDRGETPRQAANREVREETGYAGRLVYLGQSSNDAWSTLTRYHFLVTQARLVGTIQPDDHEWIEVERVSLPKFRQLLKAGMMTDAETAYRGLDHLGWL